MSQLDLDRIQERLADRQSRRGYLENEELETLQLVAELTKEREANKRKDEQRYRISDLEAELMKSHDSISEIYSAWDSERLDYADQITMLEQVLKWYADKQNWKARNRCGNCGHHFENDYDSAEWDEGARARAILEGNEPNEGNKAT
jgi:hypothetical protein